jgi:hypothetical protein
MIYYSNHMKNIIVVLALLFVLFAPFQSVLALQLNLDYPEFFGIDINNEKDQSLPAVIAWFYYFIVSISGLAAFAMLIIGGLQWLGSAGNISAISDARDRIQKAMLGLIIVLSSFLIVELINPAGTGPFSVNIETINAPSGAIDLRDAPGGGFAPGGAEGYGDGVFLCSNERCGGSVGQDGAGDAIFLPASDIEASSARNCSGDYDKSVVEYTDVFSCVTTGTNVWSDKTKALYIQGDYDVVLYHDGAEVDPKAICLSEGPSRLDDYRIEGTGDGWNKKTQRVWIVNDGFCKIPGLTVSPDTFGNTQDPAQEQPSIFLFEQKDHGATNSVTYGAPIAQLYSSWATTGNSVQVTAKSLIIQGDDNIAVKIYGPAPETICFSSSVLNLDSNAYEFSDGKIGAKERSYQPILKSDCPNSGVRAR